MLKRSARVAALIVALPLAASAGAGAPGALLQNSLQTLRDAGFPALEKMEVPAPPAVVPAAYRAADETADAFRRLIAVVRANPQGTEIGATMAALGLDAQGETYPSHGVQLPPVQGVARIFSVVESRGVSYVILDVHSKATKELHSYLASTDGRLLAAAVTTKSNGQFHAVATPLPDASASAGFDDEVRFWTQYSRDHSNP